MSQIKDTDAIANVAVKDLDRARRFYETALGLEVVGQEGGEVLVLKSGSTRIFAYRSQFAGTNKATGVSWVVGNDVPEIAATLKKRGVVFEHYDMPGMKRDGDVHEGGGMKIVWFKDPDGNILSIVSG